LCDRVKQGNRSHGLRKDVKGMPLFGSGTGKVGRNDLAGK
jgi:hypothetical protein